MVVWDTEESDCFLSSVRDTGSMSFFFCFPSASPVIALAREPKRTRLLPTVLDLRPGILPLSNRNQPPPMCRSLALEQLSGRRPATSVPSANARPYSSLAPQYEPHTELRPFNRMRRRGAALFSAPIFIYNFFDIFLLGV
ncbi:hypothetical protein RIF29_45997 [Crotalaria pallida]|uniref:Uncharacterized protein n=1 Tax=Crotalaria pallida TaxID=3830 RepID=A0AAN9DUA6_CROPI